jgi:hypothetical protein
MSESLSALGGLIVLGLSYPGLLTAVWLLFPERVEEARLKITEKPGRSLWTGFLVALGAAIPGAFLFLIPSPLTKTLGWIWVTVLLGFSSLGTAGITAELGLRVNWKNDGAHQSLGAFIRGSLIWELAAIFPLIGWFLVIPLGTLISLGAGVSTLRRVKEDQEEK